MIDSIQNILVQVSDFLWSYIIITILICCAVFFTWRTRFVQFRLIREMVRLLLHPDKVQPEEIGQEELSMDVKVDGEMKHISSFQAFVVALASRIGTGNLAGVATAISIGGPGAVFWMWMLALLGSASAFIESTLAQLYKRKGKTAFYGGPAYYMKYGLGKGWMGILFAVLMIITFGFAYNSVQSNTICLAWQKAFGIEPATMGIILTALTLLIIFGGIQRVAKFSSTVVPVMAVVYRLIAVGVVIWNITSLPKVLLIIIENAFGFNQAAGSFYIKGDLMKKMNLIAIIIFVVLGLAYFFLKSVATNQERSNVFSVSEIKNDDSTYKYVKEKCDSGFFSQDSENCVNLRKAR